MLFLFPLYNRDPPLAKKVFQPRSEAVQGEITLKSTSATKTSSNLRKTSPKWTSRSTTPETTIEPPEALNRLAVLSCFFTTRNFERCWAETMWHVAPLSTSQTSPAVASRALQT